MFNLRNRSFLKEIDFERRELRHLLQLSEAIKIAKYAGTETKRLEGKEIALIFEKTSTRTRSAFEVAAFDQGAHVTYLDPSGSQLGHKESVADTARSSAGCTTPSSSGVTVKSTLRCSPSSPGPRVQRSHRRMASDADARRLPDDARGERQTVRRLTYTFVGDCRFNMGRSLLVTGALVGADVRLAGPASLAPPDDVVKVANDIARARARGSRSPRTWVRPFPVSTSCTPTCGCRWVSPRTSGPNASSCSPRSSQRRAVGEDRQPAGEVHALSSRLP